MRALGGRPSALAALAAAVVALAVASCGSGGDSPEAHSASVSSGRGPSCLPASVDHSAKLAGVSVEVSPVPGSVAANPQTQISFLGVPAVQIHGVSAVGAHSGDHPGTLQGYSQGDGASFVPKTAFAAGEQVVVRATIGAAQGGKQVTFSFRVDTPYSTAAVGAFPNPTPSPSEYQTFVTLPGVQAPIMTVTTADRDAAAGDIFTSNGPGPGRYGPLIYTPQGQLVWFDQLPAGVTADNLSVQTYRGQPALTWWRGRVLSLGFGQGEDIIMNTHYTVLATVKGGNGLEPDLHEFQIGAGDTAYVTAYNPIHCDLSPAGGPHDGEILDGAVQAIDIKTGLVRWEWHSIDHIDVNESETSPPSSRAWDWLHINSIEPQADGNVLISARNTWAAYQIESGTGTIVWRLGGLKSSFKMGPGTKTAWQHDARILANGDVTIFDDGSNPPEEPQSRAVRIAIDLNAHTARLVSAYTHPAPPLLAASQGNMQTLASGNTVVGYGGVPQISEFATDGSLIFDAHQPLDMLFYRAYRFPWSARPLSVPLVVANLNNTGEETILHMSWNGATGVASWRALAGTTRGTLALRTTIGSTGFETSTILPKTYRYAAVAALDSAGHVLGTSRTVAVKSFAASFPTSGRSK